MSRPALRLSLGALWLATLAGATLTASGLATREIPAPHDALTAAPGTVIDLAIHNALVALWPLALVVIGWPALAGVRVLGDAAITAQLLGHGLLVGSALGDRPELWRFLPHLPLEWLAIAVPAAAWITARTRPKPHRRDWFAIVGLTAAALVGAAVIETYLVPLP